MGVQVLARTHSIKEQKKTEALANTIQRETPAKKTTYRSPKGTEKQINYILIKRSKDAEANDMIHMRSDHRCVMATFVINTPKRDGLHDTNKTRSEQSRIFEHKRTKNMEKKNHQCSKKDIKSSQKGSKKKLKPQIETRNKTKKKLLRRQKPKQKRKMKRKHWRIQKKRKQKWIQ